MPLVATSDSTTMIVVSDIHYGASSTADAYGHADAQLALALNPDYVAPVGDWANGSASPTEYANKVDPDWGALKSRFRPAIGNHEYEYTTDYDTYFPPSQRTWGTGDSRTEDYWSWNTSNGWHVVSLNYNLSDSIGSAQYNWLAGDLAANRGFPTIILDHGPRYSDGLRGDQSGEAAIWGLAMQQKTDLFISGNDHGYQRWQRINNSKQADPNGVRQLVVGVGGYGDNSVYGLPYDSSPLREFATVAFHGIVRLTLHINSYDVEFLRVPSEGGGIVDAVYNQPVLNVRNIEPDTVAPTSPTGLAATTTDQDRVKLVWIASTDNFGVAGYTVYRDGVAAATVDGQVLNYSDGGLQPQTTYTYTVDAFDAAGNRSPPSASVQATTLAPDVQAPSVPTGLAADTVGSTSISLTWNPSSDDYGVAGYTLYRDGVAAGTSTTTMFTDTGLSPASSFTYAVDAFDAASNHSARSTTITATTTARPISFVQAGSLSSGSRRTSIALSLTKPVAAGDLLTGLFTQWDATGQVQVSDNVNGSWTRAQAITYSTGKGDIALYYVPRSAASPTGLSITISAGASTYLYGSVGEYSGVASSSPLDQVALRAGSGTAVDSGPTGSIPAGELVFAALTGNNNPGTITGGSSQGVVFTTRSTYGSISDADILSSSAGPQNARFSISNSVTWYAVAAVFKPELTVLDTTAPTRPMGLTAGISGPGEVGVAWSASTDNVGVTGYTLYRNGALLATVAGSVGSYLDVTVSPSTTYTYSVDAFDAAGNHSSASEAVSVTMPAQSDTTPPSTPTGLSVAQGAAAEVDLAWRASEDNVGVAGYTIYRDGTAIASVSGSTLSYADKTVTSVTAYVYAVEAFDAAGNRSSYSATASITTGDWVAPAIVVGLAAIAMSSSEIDLGWQASTDNVAVVGYDVYRNGVLLATVTTVSHVDGSVTPSTTYSYTVDAFDAAGNHSAQSQPVNVTTPTPIDTTPPSTPTGLNATVGAGQVDLAWNASTDNVEVTGYTVYRNGVGIGTVSGSTLSYADKTAASVTSYTYRVDAFDAASNHSEQSYPTSITTSDWAPPSVPTGLGGTAIPGAVVLTWNASADNVGVAGYTVYREGAPLATVGGSAVSFTDTAVSPATTYTYALDAFDSAGNHSASSQTIGVTVPAQADTTPPSAPTGLTATTLSTSTIRLTWSASVDDVGVTGYAVYRDGVQVATVGAVARTYDDGGLSAGTTYSYTAVALDAAGNRSAASAPATGTTASAAKARFVQAATSTTGSKVTSLTIRLGPVAAGDLIVGWFAQWNSGGQVRVSDDVNGSWTRGPSTTYANGKGDIALYYVANSKPAPSGVTITVRSDSSTYLAGTAAEYAGVAASSPLETAAIRSGSGTSAVSGTTASVAEGELVYAAVTTNNNPGTVSAVSPYTLRSRFDTCAEEDMLSAASGPQTASFTFTAATRWYSVAAVFKLA